MTFPDPVAGLVIRYSYLWHSEKKAGATEGAKDRPAAIVMKQVRPEGQNLLVFVVPVTHTEPKPPVVGVPIPPKVAKQLGLDNIPQWVIVSEVNYFDWPGYDLRTDPKTGQYDYGMIPREFFEVIAAEFKKLVEGKKVMSSNRNDEA